MDNSQPAAIRTECRCEPAVPKLNVQQFEDLVPGQIPNSQSVISSKEHPLSFIIEDHLMNSSRHPIRLR